MNPSLKKRFWTAVVVHEIDGGFAVFLDKHRLTTPAKAPLVLPTLHLAEALADEWRIKVEKVDPETMPMTRRANAAIDKVAPQLAEVAQLLAAYGGSDLLCYRAAHPIELAQRQAAMWDPLLVWAQSELEVNLATTIGVMPVAQNQADLARLQSCVTSLDAFSMAGFHDLVMLSGSLVIALALISGHRNADHLWRASRVDEDWQTEMWGIDEEAEQTAALKQAGFLNSFSFFQLVNPA